MRAGDSLPRNVKKAAAGRRPLAWTRLNRRRLARIRLKIDQTTDDPDKVKQATVCPDKITQEAFGPDKVGQAAAGHREGWTDGDRPGQGSRQVATCLRRMSSGDQHVRSCFRWKTFDLFSMTTSFCVESQYSMFVVQLDWLSSVHK